MIKEQKKFLKEKIEKIVNTLQKDDQIDVVIPDSIENFKLTHPVGAILITYKGSEYTESPFNFRVAQNRDMTFTLFVVARKKNLDPEEYIDLLLNLSLHETDAQRADRQIKVIKDEFIDETNGVWTYAIDVLVPKEFYLM